MQKSHKLSYYCPFLARILTLTRVIIHLRLIWRDGVYMAEQRDSFIPSDPDGFLGTDKSSRYPLSRFSWQPLLRQFKLGLIGG